MIFFYNSKRKIKKQIWLCFCKKCYECGCMHTWSGNITVQSLGCVQFFVTPWTTACQASLTFAISQSLPKLMPIESVIRSNHLVLYWPLLLLSPIFPIIRVFSNESAPHIMWSKYCSFSISPSTQYSGLISFRIDWFDLPAVWTDIAGCPLGGGNMYNFWFLLCFLPLFCNFLNFCYQDYSLFVVFFKCWTERSAFQISVPVCPVPWSLLKLPPSWVSAESESHSGVSDSLWSHGLHSPWNSPGQNTGVGSLSLLQRIFPIQELNQGLLHCRWILYQLS